MKKLKSIWLKLCLVSFLLGTVLTVTGFCMGAGKYMDSKYHETEGNEKITIQETYKDIKNLDISLAFTELEIKEGEEISVTGIGIEPPKLELENENGTLKIHKKSNNILNHFGVYWNNGLNIGFSDQGSSKIMITIPKGVQFEHVSLGTGAGTMNVSELSCNNLEASIGAGEGTMKNISVTGEADIEVGAGSLTLQNLSADLLELECGMGELVMDGVVGKFCTVNCGMGEINMNLKGNLEEYRYSVACGMGDVEINDDSYSGLGTDKEQGNGEKVLELECGMGTIKVQIQP